MPARPAVRAIAQILLCYEVPPSGLGTGRNNQYQIVGSEGSIFWDLDMLQPGDVVVVETVNEWHIYKVSQNHVVLPNAVEVVAPVPGVITQRAALNGKRRLDRRAGLRTAWAAQPADLPHPDPPRT